MEQAATIIGGDGRVVERRWEVDLAAAAGWQKWAREQPALLGEEVAEMGRYFPRWLLVLANDNAIRHCGRCGERVIFAEGAARCIGCWAPVERQRAQQLGWLGHLPTPVGGLKRALKRIRANPHPAYPLIEAGGAPIWLVPIMAYYPATWPHGRPVVGYDKNLFKIMDIASPNAAHHIVGGDKMCLYGGEDQIEVSLRTTLQQRVVNHLASMLKVGDGQQPHDAFAGRQHSYNYQDYR